jgi:hypothetical protein
LSHKHRLSDTALDLAGAIERQRRGKIDKTGMRIGRTILQAAGFGAALPPKVVAGLVAGCRLGIEKSAMPPATLGGRPLLRTAHRVK